MIANFYQTGFTHVKRRLNLNLFRYTAMLVLLLTLAIGNVWGSRTYYATMNVAVASTGGGTVYVNASGTTSQTKSASSTSSSTSISFNIYATASAGYKFSSWSGSGITFGSATTANTTGAISSNSQSSPGTTKTATASFVAIEATAAPANVNITATDPSVTYPESTDARTLTFTTTSSNALTDFTYAPANGASGKYTFANWRRVDATHVAVDYTFAGGGNYGGLTRVHQVNVTLKGKEHATVQTCTITATFPNAKIIDGAAEEVFAAYNPADATQAGVAKTAVFDVERVDGTNNFDTPTFTGAGASHFTYNSMSYADGKLTVNYTYNGNKEAGTHTATLTLKVNDAIGGTDATYGSKAITITAHNEQEATDDASVTTAANVTTNYATFAAALAAANASSGCTLTLLRNVDLGTITATNNITKAMTIDLNGKELRAAVNASSVGILTITQAVAVTIKDSKTGGKIINEVARNSEIRTIFVNKAGATLTLESGTIVVNNLGQYASAANSTLGVAKYASCSARVIHQVAGSTVNINGGRLEAYGTRSVYGIVQGSSAATNKAGTTVLNITDGEIYAEGPYSIMGVYAYGKVNFSGGTITAHVNTNMIDAYYAADNANNTYNGYGYGIYLYPSASATATSCYAGILNMTGGTINVTNDRTSNVNRPHYGVLFGATAANVSSATAVAADGKSHGQIASATGSIDGGEINVTSGTQYSYGVYVGGSYNSYDNTHHTVQIKNCKITSKAYVYAYGVYAYAAINSTNGASYAGDVELTNCDVYAESLNTSTAAAVWVASTSSTIFKDGTTANAATWGGEFAVAGKAVINNGKYEAKTKTSSAYAVGTSSRSKTTYDAQTTVIANRTRGGHAEAYPTLIIHGGTFKATSITSTARGVSNGGYCTIDGGEFEAYATTTTAHGLYCLTGKITASGVKVSASATGTSYGAYAAVSIPAGNQAQTGFAVAGELELNNCDITATTRTSTEARGVFVEATNKLHSWAGFLADSTSYTSSWAANKNNYAAYYRRVFPCTVAGRDSVGIAIAAKATINGCDIKATAGTTTAYGVYSTATSVPALADSVASPVVNIKNSKFTVKTDGTTTAYGMYAGGPTTIDGCDFTVQPKTTTAYGVYAYDKKTTITNTKFDVKGTNTVYGLYANAAIGTTTGWDYHGEFELGEGNDMTVAATGGNTSHVLTLIATKKNVASGRFMGDYANAASAHITGGSYKATATGTTSYVLNLSANQVQNAVSAAPTCTIEGGKFWAKADGGTTGICTTNGVNGNILFKGGVYNVNTTLAKHIPEGLEEVTLPSDRPEYSEGYRYEVAEMGVHGGYVCQIGSTKYRTLEEALQVVTSGQVIYMIDNYNMMTPGDYILPSNTTLLIPYKTGSGKGATTAIGNSAVTNSSAVAPYLFRKLTFGPGVNLTCSGTIETSAEQKCNGQYAACVGMPSGAYGQIHLMEGSHISMESGSRLNCWGYVTGKGTINAKNGSTVLEGFQLGDWCGGSNANTLLDNSQKVFPITHYFYQSIECPITYRPGCSALGSTHIYASSTVVGQDGVKLVGTTGALFLMDNKDASEDTWVMKDYDEETDQCVWTMNSGATLGNLSINLSAGWISYPFESANYDLPITTNMTIILNNGTIGLSQNTVFLPGSKLIVNKQGTLEIDGINVVAYDAAEWTGTTVYRASYSPTWGTTNPRSTTAVDAEFFLHGKVNIKSNGGLYTTESGANVHSTNADAGEVIYTTAAQGNKTSYYLQQGGTTRTARTAYPAKLKNGDGSYESSAGTASGKTWTYKNDVWDAWTKDGCFFMNAQDKPHAKPAELVELTSKTPDANHLHHDAATGARNFVWDENCYWWEVVTTPTAEGYYQSLNPDNNGKYNYYEYNSAAGCWKIKTITVTWSINGNNTNYTVGYGTKPHWLGATPTKSSSSSDYVWRWDGWTLGSDPTVYENEELPVVTANTTFTAHFYEKYYQSLVTFKNDDGTVLDSRLWNRGTTPSYEGTPTKEATAAQTFEFNGSWSPAITAVGSSSVEYVAQYTATTRQYNVEFVNYDMSPLGSILVDYNATPTTATYKAAIAPSDYEPYKPDNSAYSFNFSGWKLNGASSNGFAQVKGDQTYVAQFTETTKKYRISFVDEDGETVLHWTQLEYDAMPSYDGPATTNFNKQDDEWEYVFTGWDPAEFTQVKGPQTYTATYNKTKRKYTITWIDGNGNTLTTTNVEYGTTPTYPGTPTPTKASTSEHSYEFNNTWSPALAPVTGEATYIAQFNETERTYALTIGVNNAEYGSVNHDYVSGISYNAAVTVNNNTFTVNGTTVTATPTTATAQYTYAFSSWSNVPNNVTADVSNIQANFTRTLRQYDIVWKSEDGTSTLETDANQEYGTTTAFNGTTPTKAQTAQYTYTFDGWATEANGDKVYEIGGTPTVGGAATYYVHFRSQTRSYTVTFNANGHGTAPDDITNVEYNSTITAPAAPSAAEWVFGGWYKESGCTNAWNFSTDKVTGATTLYAKWTQAVASVTAGGLTTYHATIADAISAANGKTGATVTMLQSAPVTSEITISAAMTIDLNGKTISSTLASATGVFNINGSGKTITIKDSGTGGKISHVADYGGYLYGINLVAGSLEINGGHIYAENTKNAASSSNYRAIGIYYASGNNKVASVTMSDGKVEAKRKQTFAYAICLYTGNCGLSMTGGEVIASGTGNIRGIYTQGTATLSNKAIVAASASGSENCYTIFSDKNGSFTINGGTYTATGAGTDVYPIAMIKASSAPTGGSATINGGRFSGKNKEVYVSGGTATLKGGYYVHDTELEGKCATNYHVLPASLTEAGITYNYKVAEAYTVSFNANGHGTAPSSQLIEKNQKVTEPSAPSETGWTFGGWYKEAGCTNEWNFASDVVTDATTLYAKWTVAESGFWLDIVDVDNSAKTLTINTNSWASAGWSYTINDVVYEKSARKTDRTLIIPYTGEVGATFSVTVKDKLNAVVSKHNYIIPAEIKSDANLGDQQVVYVKNNATLTVAANKTVQKIYVAPGAKLVVNSGVELTADTVFLRTTPWASAELELDETLTGQVCYTRIISKKDQYYQFGLPMQCPIAAVRLSDGTTPTYGGGWLLRSYSEQNRAQNGSGADIDNWVTLTNEGADVNKTIQGGVGYEMFSNSGYYREYYFPVAHTGLSDRVAVTHTTGEAGESHSGWNIVVSPLMRAYTQSPAPEGMTVSWLQQDGSYWQLPVEEIKPAIPFSYQATETGYITFGENIGLSALAPRRVTASEEQVRIQWLQLDVEAADGKTDQTSIYSHPTRYERTYKTGIDVAKQSLTASRAILYSSHVYGDMAFAGVADSLLEAGVALTVYSPSAQELTISMRENDWLNRLVEVWLIDHETGARMNLLDGNYTFDAAAGTTSGRFTIQGVFYAPQVTTDIQNGQAEEGQGAKARKMIIEDKMYILLNGQMFDATGKMVNK